MRCAVAVGPDLGRPSVVVVVSSIDTNLISTSAISPLGHTLTDAASSLHRAELGLACDDMGRRLATDFTFRLCILADFNAAGSSVGHTTTLQTHKDTYIGEYDRQNMGGVLIGQWRCGYC